MVRSYWELKREVSRALTRFFGEHGWINRKTITAYHIPNAVHPFIVPVQIEGLLLPPMKDPSVMDCIYQCAVMFLEKRDVRVDMETKYNSISMQKIPKISKEPMIGKSTK